MQYTVQYSTVQLDTRALALLADSCTNLTTLGFYNCGFREGGPGPGAGAELLAADVAARRREQEEEAALALSCSWLDVERLTITSEVGVPEDNLYSVLTWSMFCQIGAKLLTVIMSMCLNLKQVSLGMNTSIR